MQEPIRTERAGQAYSALRSRHNIDLTCDVKPRATLRNRAKKPNDLTDAEVSKQLHHALFKSVCRILEAGRTQEELKKLRHQQAILEKKLGYDVLERNRWLAKSEKNDRR
jgi:hypothetical protein